MRARPALGGYGLTTRSPWRILVCVGLATRQPTLRTSALTRLWQRWRARRETTTIQPLERITADLRRLEREAERLGADETIVARGQRLMAVRLAFDLTLVDAARAVEVPVPETVPFTSNDRLIVCLDLTRAGVSW